MTGTLSSDGARAAPGTGAALRTRWLGTVPYDEALALQRGFHRSAVMDLATGVLPDDRLLLLEHPHTYTLGRNGDPDHVLVSAESVGAGLIRTDRGGDVTYHGPGQLVAYPLVTLTDRRGRSVLDGGVIAANAWVTLLESLIIETLGWFGVEAGRRPGYPGVWCDRGASKIAAVGVRLERGRTLHGVALNVDPDLSMFEHIVPCGITDGDVTAMRAQGSTATIRDVVDAFEQVFVKRWAPGTHERSDVIWRDRTDGDGDLSAFSRGLGPGAPVDGSNRSVGTGHVTLQGSAPRRHSPASPASPRGTSVRLSGRLAEAGVTDGVEITDRKPEWMRAKVNHDPTVMGLKHTMSDLDLVTVCEEAGCPNLSECWSAGTATFMINGERCTRACGFCLVDTRKPRTPGPRRTGPHRRGR